MAEQQIRFDDGAAYERMMGTWSRLAGDIFLDWLAPRPGLRWIDCGSGAFTELLVERCAPAEVQGIDPSEAELAFARPAARLAQFRRGGASASRDVECLTFWGYEWPQWVARGPSTWCQ
jgi:trans-aconitate methyltransferase